MSKKNDDLTARLWSVAVEATSLALDLALEKFKEDKTEPVHSNASKKTSGKASDLGSAVCRFCTKPIHLTSSGEMNVYWVHTDNEGSHCTLFATPQG